MSNDLSMVKYALAVIFAVVVAGALYQSWPILFPAVQVEAKVDPACDLRAGACTTELAGGGRVTFSIEPREIPVMRPLQLQVNIEGVDAESVEVDLSGADMYMGLNRAGLTRSEDGSFGGESIIPVCIRDAMEWEAKVMVNTSRGLFVAPYRFIAVKPGLALPQ